MKLDANGRCCGQKPLVTDDELIAYLRGLKPGERVIETDRTSCFRGREGTVYLNDGGDICVLWDKRPGESGQMGTSVTGGTRRLKETNEN